MSRSLNRAILIGRAGAAPQLRTAATGVHVATFSLATDRRTRGARAEAKPDWHRIVAWDGLAEQVAARVSRGDLVYVEGRIEYRAYEDRSGRSRTVTEIVADDLIVIESRAGGAEQSTSWKERIVS